ncbi:MAG: cyclase family protein [Pseudomonadota bacterium]
MIKVILLIFLIAISQLGNAADFSNGRWIDLTHEFSDQTIYWPTSEKFSKTTVAEGHTDAGYYYSAYNIATAEHGGTHVDAPIHFFENRHTVDQIPIEQLIGGGITIRVLEQVAADRNYQFSVADIKRWEKEHGQIPAGSIVLIDTGSSKLWPDPLKYMGTDKRGPEGVRELKFPGIHPEAAEFLANERNIKAVGLDTPSIDFGGSTLYETHQILFEQNIPGLENVANLDQLPEKGFTVIALPMKVKDGSGSPLRIVAFVPQ